VPTYSTTSVTTTKACLLVLAGGFAAQHNRLPIDSDHCNALFVAVILIFAARHLRWFAFLLLGFTLFVQAGNDIVNARLDPRVAGDSMLVTVRIADFPKVTGASVSMLIEALDDPRMPARSRVTWYDPPKVPSMGDIWEFELRLRRPRGNSNPGVFSLENWMFREKLHAAGYIVPGRRNRLIDTGSLSWAEAYRHDFVTWVEANGGNSAPVLAAIGVGARHLISREQWDRYAKTGTSHLMAISGLHIGLAAAVSFGLVALLSGIFRLRGNHLDRAAVVSAMIAAFYAMISGFAVPSQRATVMLGFVGIAFLCRRRTASGRIVALVALFVFVIDPVSLMTPGFGLSFGAVTLLLWFAKAYWRPAVGVRFRNVLGMQFVLLLGLMPLTVLTFHRVAVAAPIANLLTVPVFSLITVPLTLASMMVRPVWNAAADQLLWLGGTSIQAIEWLIGVFADLPIADTFVAGVDGPDTAILCFIFLPVIWVVLPRGWPGRWMGALGVIALLLHKPAPPPHGCFDTDVLDVGQGLAVVVQSRRSTLVFDTGRSYRGGGSAAEQFVLPFLRHRGIHSIDRLVVSHADDDHAGGVPALVRHLDVGRILAGEAIPDVGETVFYCRAGQFWRANGVEFSFMHPGAGNGLSGNDASCVLVVSAGSHHLVVTGDIETAAEREVLRRYPFATASVVVIPHHGSLTSSSPPFVNRLKPIYAIASAGYANRWGFPKERVKRRWEGSGAVVLDTASSGAISFRLCAGDGISLLHEERQRRRRFWHD
jgi:competence protein ComEC